MPRLIFDNDGTDRRVYAVVPGHTTVGRSDQNTLTIPHPSVSGFHCELLASWRELIVRDLNSSNGTFLNGECLRAQQRPLKHGDLLQIGEAVARVDMSDVPPDDIPTELTANFGQVCHERGREEHPDKPPDHQHVTLQPGDGNPPAPHDHTLVFSAPEAPRPLPSPPDAVPAASAPGSRFPASRWTVAALLAALVGIALWLIVGAGWR
ncbi:MAG: FHA domain-containing protein [Planctomycetes bacterium]|nr:FHA domain-containing protein [Planctomycetota bacterium]